MAEVSVFKPLAFTKLGLMLEAKLRTGVPLQLTRVKIGDGTLEEGESPLDITELKHEVTSHQTGTEGTGAKVDMSNFKVLEAGITDLRVIVESNDSDFVLRELAIMAQDPDVGEIPYLYTYGGTDAFKSGVTVHRTYNFTDIITNATDIQVNTTVVDGAPLEDFEAHKEQIASITDFGHIKLYSKSGVNTSGLLINEDGTLVVNIDNRHGLYRSGAGQITVAAASEEDIAKRTDEYKPIVPARLSYIFENAALTGTPTAPTASNTSNSKQIANTAFVKNISAALNKTVCRSTMRVDISKCSLTFQKSGDNWECTNVSSLCNAITVNGNKAIAAEKCPQKISAPSGNRWHLEVVIDITQNENMSVYSITSFELSSYSSDPSSPPYISTLSDTMICIVVCDLNFTDVTGTSSKTISISSKTLSKEWDSLFGLKTDDKSSIVAAINELYDKISALS